MYRYRRLEFPTFLWGHNSSHSGGGDIEQWTHPGDILEVKLTGCSDELHKGSGEEGCVKELRTLSQMVLTGTRVGGKFLNPQRARGCSGLATALGKQVGG